VSPASGRVAVLASFNVDVVVSVPRRPVAGETVHGTAVEEHLGGKGFNQAGAARRAGAAVQAIGRLGDDAGGRRFLDVLDAEGIAHGQVAPGDAAGTGTALIVVDDAGENSIIVVPRANHAVAAADVDAAADAIASSGALLVQLEVPIDAVVAAARCARRAGVPVVLNPAPAADALDRLAGLVDVIVPNQTEAALLTGRSPDDDPDELAAALRDRLGCAVVLTLGAAGALVLDGDGPTRLAAHAVPVVDTVGAGDAFCGALGAALAAGDDLRAAAARGNAAGALATTRRGAEPSMPTAAAVDDLLAAAPTSSG
jgi:ribokinase